MFIIGLGTAVPLQVYTQRDSWDALHNWSRFSELKPRSRAILKKVLCGDNGIATRHLALDPLTEVFEQTPDKLQARFAKHAPALATEAARRALTNAGCLPQEMDAVIISTCTGYLCPGLTSYVSEQLGLRENIFALDLVGQGCGAALPNLRAGASILAAGSAKRVLSICVEVCSAAFFIDDDAGVLISACLFADGAGAAILAKEPLPKRRRVEWKFTDSRLLTGERETLRFSHQNGMLRNILLPQVPQVASDLAERLFAESLVAAGVRREQITGWILHTGGRDVILAMRDKLKLSADDVRHTSAVLHEFGNISSPSVYFVLERTLADAVPDGLWWMCAFGAGFSCHGAFFGSQRRVKRIVQPEILDTLPPLDPRAVKSRQDLCRINYLMQNQVSMARTLEKYSKSSSPKRIVELGAGDGKYLLSVAKQLSPMWPNTEVTLLDLQKNVTSETLAGFDALGWRADSVVADVFAWPANPDGAEIVVANLFLHHFENARLVELLRLISERTKLFIALEPRRAAWPLVCSRLLWAIGCNDVTRHDAVVSVRAGFSGAELSALWPDKRNWQLTESRSGLCGHHFIAQKTG